MPRPLLLALLFLAALAATLALLGVFDSESPLDDTPARPPPVADRTGEPTGEGDPSLVAGEPTEEPALEGLLLDHPVRVLVLAPFRERWNAWFTQQLEQESIAYRAWFQTLRPGEMPPRTEGKDPILEPPTGRLLEDDDADVVILQDLAPSALPDDFWEALARRVSSGRTGLLVLAGTQGGPALLDDPRTAALVPIATAKPFEGTPPAGVFGAEAPLLLETAAASHPAVRFVGYAGWNQRIWTGTRVGNAAWSTKFCYPVETVKEGAAILLRADGPRPPAYPALVASDPGAGRVIWMGFPDFGDRSYRDPKSLRKMHILFMNWLVWLAGQAA